MNGNDIFTLAIRILGQENDFIVRIEEGVRVGSGPGAWVGIDGIANAGRGLVAGLYATGRVASVTRRGLTVPLTAVDQRGIKPIVLRLKGGKAERVEVTLGMRDEATENVEITSGVAAGDTLLVGAAQGITPGSSVKVSQAAPSADLQKKK
jgi:hypothetical protein